jgi:hypothetical protein
MRFRTFFLLLGIVLVMGSCHRGSHGWEAFRASYPGGSVTIRIHPWMKWGLGVAAELSHDPETAALVAIAKRMKAVEIHVFPRGAAPFAKALDRLDAGLKADGYASFVSLRSHGTQADLWAKDRAGSDELRDPRVLIADGDEMVLVKMTGVVKTGELNALLACAGSPAKN